jgi:hypothetical protein
MKWVIIVELLSESPTLANQIDASGVELKHGVPPLCLIRTKNINEKHKRKTKKNVSNKLREFSYNKFIIS